MNHKQKVTTGIAALQLAFPKLFNRDQPKPLAIGTTLQLAKLRRSGVLCIPLAIQRAAMNSWLASPNISLNAVSIQSGRHCLRSSLGRSSAAVH